MAGLTGVRRALERRGMELVGEVTYMRNTVAVKRALLGLLDSDPEAVIIIGAYRPAAHFIKWARKIGMVAVFVNISFVGSNALLEELGPHGDGVVVTQVVPFPARHPDPGRGSLSTPPWRRSTKQPNQASSPSRATWPAVSWSMP